MLSLDLFPKTPNMNDGTIYLQISCLPLIITFYSCTMYKSEHSNCSWLPELGLVHHYQSECLSPNLLGKVDEHGSFPFLKETPDAFTLVNQPF